MEGGLTWLIITGAALTLAGLAGIVWGLAGALRARRDKLDDAAMKARLQKLVAVNLAAMGLSGLGLACIIVGILMGG